MDAAMALDMETNMSKPVDLSAINDWDGYLAACAQGGSCTKCKGTGKNSYTGTSEAFREAFKPFEGRPCCFCDGKGQFPGFDPLVIVKECFVLDKKTGKPKRFRRSAPDAYQNRHAGSVAARAYYVWRMARFHGGADVHMPMEAIGVVEGDPMGKLLDPLASAVAKIAFGDDRAGAYRWGRLLIDPTLPEYPPGVALSGSSHGPVVLTPELDHEPA